MSSIILCLGIRSRFCDSISEALLVIKIGLNLFCVILAVQPFVICFNIPTCSLYTGDIQLITLPEGHYIPPMTANTTRIAHNTTYACLSVKLFILCSGVVCVCSNYTATRIQCQVLFYASELLVKNEPGPGP